MPPTIQPPLSLLVEGSRIHRGFFELPCKHVNLLDAELFGGRWARALRWLRLKEWVGFCFGQERLFGAMIIQDAKYAGSGTVYLFDRVTGEYHEWQVVDFGARLAATLWRDTSRCGRGRRRLEFEHNLCRCRHTVRVRIPATRKQPSLRVELVLHQDWRRTAPLVMSLPISPEHHTYTHKSPLHLEGTITVGDRAYEFVRGRDLGALDEQRTLYPYRSHWLWGTFAAHSTEGREVAVNFVNQMTPTSEPGEDAMWVDGKLMLIERPAITRDQPSGTYRIEDAAGRLALTFSPKGAIEVKRDLRVLAIDYAQHFGPYNGVIVDDTGRSHTIRNAFGALERMRARF